jgi:hypothetical protein
MGIEALEKFMDEKAIDIEVKEPIVVAVPKDCVPGKVCEAKDYFEMITECAICGKLS